MKAFDIKKIFVPIDFSNTSLKALDHAVYMAKFSDATIILMHNTGSLSLTVSPGEYYASSIDKLATFEKDIYNKAKIHLEKLAAEIEKKKGVKTIVLTTSGWVKEEILSAVKKMKADMIIMGTHGTKGFREQIIGTNTFRIVNEAKCPVLSVSNKTKTTGFKNILLPFRDKPHSREKVDYALKIAELYGSTIHVLGIDTEESKADLKKIEQEATQIKNIIESSGIACKVKTKSSPYLSEKVLEHAKKVNADLIVIMADMDKMRVSDYFMGPFTQQIVNHSPVPVLSIRPTFNPNTIDLHEYGW